MTNQKPTIIYTKTDEAPALATRSFLPIIDAFTNPADINVEVRDISLAGRILAHFPDYLNDDQKVSDDLAYLGELAKTPEANIIKLPNISASVPQLKAAIAELQEHGYALPNYPEDPSTDEEREINARYEKVKGSAVNPVLRQGNSDRRAPKAVKEYAKSNPHRMGAWSSDCRSHVATMDADDFFHTEQSVTVDNATTVRIEHVAEDGSTTVLKDELALLAGEVIDSGVMRKAALVSFLQDEIDACRENDLLFSLHLKATMMKVSDPRIFGHAVRVYFSDLLEKHADTLDEIGFDPNNGFGDLTSRLDELPDDKRAEIEADIQAAYDNGPDISMVNSDKGITNLHVPSDVIIDASMPAMIRNSGQLWDKDGDTQDTKAVIPDSSYASLYQVVIDDCRENGAYDPTTMGTVQNVGLMAQKAEEYGSHDKTFEIDAVGKVRVVDGGGQTLMEHDVAPGDIWRMCQTKDVPIKDWVQLAVRRAKATGFPAVFWLDENRPHDAQLIEKVNAYISELDAEGTQLHILSTADATKFSVDRIRQGLNTIAVTGNVLRDYLTDLFPILEVGTSAKMLSIVPLLAGGGLFETGAGGSAPKHVQQFEKEGHLRWDSLGEFLALAVSLEHVADTYDHAKARVLGEALDDATTRYLLTDKSPSRKVNELDNRGSHFYLAMYWAQALAEQDEDEALKEKFTTIALKLADAEETINAELLAAQGDPVDLGGYFDPNDELGDAQMRPSETLNQLLAEV